MLEKLKQYLPEKDMWVLNAILTDSSAISYDFRRMDRAFIGAGMCVTSGKAHCPERHLLVMFRLLYTMGCMVYVDMLPLLSTMYLLRTRKAIGKRCPLEEVKENSYYAKVVGKNVFDLCLKRFKLIHPVISFGANAVPIDMEKASVVSIDMANSTRFYAGEKIFLVEASPARAEDFDSLLRKKLPAFEVTSAGILMPVNISSPTTMEDL